MTASKSLPARPSLESLRKQAKKLARDIAAGDAGAVARARAHLPHVDLPLTQRNAQLVVAVSTASRAGKTSRGHGRTVEGVRDGAGQPGSQFLEWERDLCGLTKRGQRPDGIRSPVAA